jgi:hypothetical protein
VIGLWLARGLCSRLCSSSRQAVRILAVVRDPVERAFSSYKVLLGRRA